MTDHNTVAGVQVDSPPVTPANPVDKSSAECSVITVVAYGPNDLYQCKITNPSQLQELMAKYPIAWINVDGPANQEILSKLAEIFQLHPLALEDVLHTNQRAKVEDYGKQQFVVTRMPLPGNKVATEQLSMFFSSNFVLTFQEKAGGDCLDVVRARLEKGVSNIRMQGSDHLAYAIIDGVIDGYFPLLEALEARLESLEETILSHHYSHTVREIHEVKRDFLALQHILRPLRDAVNFLWREPSLLVSQETRIYLRDCTDHVVRMLDQIETDRELCSDLMNLHLNTASNRMNEVMKVLTIITTLFIPPTFIAGVYGMNFRSMPELGWSWGYPFALAIMSMLVIGLLFFLRWKGWLGDLFKQR